VSELGERHPERFDPATMGGQMVEAEHVCRYLWAAPLAEGRRVLDAACGTGYGSAILAGAGAASVTAVDRSEDALRRARRAATEGVRHERADLAALPFEDGAFDLVVCFEAIEHVDDQDRVLDELVRVLAPGGVLAISSPNRDVYIPDNPHHTHEYLPDEFFAALRGRLAHVRLLRQRNWIASSVMEDAQFGAADRSRLEGMGVRNLTGYRPGQEIFTVALASDGELPAPESLTVLTHLEELRKWVEWNQHVEGVLKEAERQLAVIPVAARLQAAAEAERDRLHQELTALTRSLSWRVTAPLRALARALRARRADRRRRRS
jgi:ubiquinone/menaquinone biosynthesis C-methylase UbiE